MKLLYIILLIALPSVLFAQTNYHEGYLLKNNGDTLKGFIDYREWDQTPISVDFKTTKADKQTETFNAAAIKGFGVTGMETYISFNGLISNDKNRFPDLANVLDTSRVQGSLFLRQIATGNHLSLFVEVDGKKTRYFVAEDKATPVELKYNQYYTDQHDAIERAFFRGQLIVYANKYAPGNNSLINLIQTVPFEDDRLEEAVSKINGDSVINVNGRPKQAVSRWYLGAGVLVISTKSNGFVSALPQVSAGIDVFGNSNVQQVVFRTNLSLSGASIKSQFPAENSGNVLSFDQYTVGITPQVIYNVYNQDNFKVYVDGGIALNLSAYSDIGFSNQTEVNRSSLQLRTFWFGIPLQTGIVVNKKWEASFTYTPNTKIVPGFSDYINSRAFTLGVKFFLDNK